MKQGRDLNVARRALADPRRVYHLARREARGRRGGGDHQRRRPSAAEANASLTPATARASRAWLAAIEAARRHRDRPRPRRDSGLAAAGRRAQRARLRAVGFRGEEIGPERGRACRSCAAPRRARPPSPSRSPRLRRWRPARTRSCALSVAQAQAWRRRATRRGSPPIRERCRRRGSSPMPTRRGERLNLESPARLRRRHAGVELVEQPLPAGKDAVLAAHRAARPGLRRRVRA